MPGGETSPTGLLRDTAVPSSSKQDFNMGSRSKAAAVGRADTAPGNRQRCWTDLSSLEQLVKADAESSAKRNQVAPILVNCSGSDEGEGSPLDSLGHEQQQQQHERDQRTSIASTLDGHDSGSSSLGQAVPATRIAAADVAAGCYKTGVRYCLETWPNSSILRVRVLRRLASYVSCTMPLHTSCMPAHKGCAHGTGQVLIMNSLGSATAHGQTC